MKKSNLMNVCAVLVLAAASAATAADDILIADFEGKDYGNWKATGDAFGKGPARGSLGGQKHVSGFKGKGLVNTFLRADKSTGTLRSPQITVQRKYIAFLIGGGHHPKQTCINLMVDGKVAFTATGLSKTGGDTETLVWESWDVSKLAGRKVVIQIVDKHTGGWGHINIDHIIQTDKKTTPRPKVAPGPAPKADDWRASYPAFVAEMQKIINAHAPKTAPRKDSAFVTFLALHTDKRGMIYVLYHGTKLRAVYQEIDKTFGGKSVRWRGTVEDVKKGKNGADVTIRMEGRRRGRSGWKYPETFTVTVPEKEGGLAAANRTKGRRMTIRGHIPSKPDVTSKNLLTGIVLYYGVGELAGEKSVAVYFDRKSLVPIDDKTARTPKQPAPAGEQTIEMTIDRKYLVLPYKNAGKRGRKGLVTVEVDGKIAHRFNIALGTKDDLDYWCTIDMTAFKGKKAALKASGVSPEGFKSIAQDDDPRLPKDLYNEKLRPQFHFSQMIGWNNDPNGMVYYKGEWHLFFQHNPFGWNWGNMTWGHAVSKDMVHWEQLPHALYPDNLGTMFSGTGFIDHNNTAGFKTGDEDVIVLAYTYAGGFGYPKCPFTQAIAYSNDRGRTFVKYKGNPVLKNQSGSSDRDPKVLWHEPTKKWVMVVYLAKGRKFGIYTSDNLKKWTKTSEIGGFHECPELFELPIDGDKANTRWVIFGADAQYIIGQFDGKTFTPDHKGKHKVHHGSYYASQTFSDSPDGRRIQIGWARIPMNGMPFNQMMGFPTRLTLRKTPDGVRMFATPVKEIANVHARKHTLKAQTIADGKEIAIDAVGRLFDIRAEFAAGDTGSFGIRVAGADIIYDAAAKTISGGRVRAPLAPVDGKISLQILVDRPSVEVCGGDGRVYITSPRGQDDGKGVKVFAKGAAAKLNSLTVHELTSVWRKK